MDSAVVASFEDVGYSGATADRPGLAALLVAEGFDSVVVPCWDRLARDNKLNGYLRYKLENERKLAVFSATEANGIDPLAELVQGVLASVAGYERHLIAQRLAGGRRIKAAQGGYAHGQAPFGLRATGNGTLEENEAEYETLTRMRELRSEGQTLRAIAATLDAEGLKPRSAASWGASSVAGALRSAARVDRVLSAAE